MTIVEIQALKSAPLKAKPIIAHANWMVANIQNKSIAIFNNGASHALEASENV